METRRSRRKEGEGKTVKGDTKNQEKRERKNR
jgi:hypothetical protein